MNVKMKADNLQRRRFLITTACALFTLSGVATVQASAEESGRFVVLPVKNPKYCGNELFRAFENFYSPRIGELRTRYGLDTVVAGETDEWKRILLLRHWIKSKIAIEKTIPHRPRETRLPSSMPR